MGQGGDPARAATTRGTSTPPTATTPPWRSTGCAPPRPWLRKLPKTWQGNYGRVLAANIAADLTA
jgi:hypothetical protein